MGLKKWKYLVFDLDGTLFCKEKKISENAIAKLCSLQEQGYVVGLATGRYHHELIFCIEALRLSFFQSFVITCNGAYVLDMKTGTHIVFRA